jgi:hypothetical protein
MAGPGLALLVVAGTQAVPARPSGAAAGDLHVESLARIGGPATLLATDGERTWLTPGDALVALEWSWPSQPRLVGLGELLLPEQRDLIARGDYAFVAAGADGLQVFDGRAGPLLRRIGHLDTGGASAIALDGGHAFLATGRRRQVVVAEVSDPTRPRQAGVVGTPGEAQDIALGQGFAYVADAAAGVVTVDVRDPARPKLVSAAPAGIGADRLAVSGRWLYAHEAGRAIHVLDLQAPGAPVHARSIAFEAAVRTFLPLPEGVLLIPDAAAGPALWVNVKVDPDGQARPVLAPLEPELETSSPADLVAADEAGLVFVDRNGYLSRVPLDPLELTGNPARYLVGLLPHAAAVGAGRAAFLYHVPGEIWMYLLGLERGNRRLSAPLQIPYGQTGSPMVALGPDVAYLIGERIGQPPQTGLAVVDLSDPAGSQPAAFLKLIGAGTPQLRLAGGQLFAFGGAGQTWERGLVQRFDVSDPTQPRARDQLMLPSTVHGLDFGPTGMVVAAREALHLVDWPPTAGPIVRSSLDLDRIPPDPAVVAVSSGHAFTVLGGTRLVAIRLDSPDRLGPPEEVPGWYFETVGTLVGLPGPEALLVDDRLLDTSAAPALGAGPTIRGIGEVLGGHAAGAYLSLRSRVSALSGLPGMQMVSFHRVEREALPTATATPEPTATPDPTTPPAPGSPPPSPTSLPPATPASRPGSIWLPWAGQAAAMPPR